MTYVFKTPFSHAETVSMVEKTITAIGGKFKNDVGDWRAKGFATVLSATAQFFFHEKENECSVRVVFRRHHTDSRRFWRTFVEKLNELYPDVDFGINAKTPYELVAVLNLTGDTEQVHFSRTSGGTSLGGFLLGGLAFGAPGAIVGGMSGTQKTVGTTQTVYSDKVNVRMLWSDGLLQERQVDKRENLYHEIMNMIS